MAQPLRRRDGRVLQLPDLALYRRMGSTGAKLEAKARVDELLRRPFREDKFAHTAHTLACAHMFDWSLFCLGFAATLSLLFMIGNQADVWLFEVVQGHFLAHVIRHSPESEFVQIMRPVG